MLHVVGSSCMTSRFVCMVVVFARLCFHGHALAQSITQMPEWRGFNDTPGDVLHGNQSTQEVQSNVSTVLMNSGRAFKTLNSHVQSIQLQLNAMQKADATALAKKAAEYERQLTIQRTEIANAESRNAHRTTEIEQLRKTNKGLRKNASILADACHKVRLEIIQMQSNVTIAMEFMHKMLNVSEVLLNSTEVQITKELDTQDLMMQKRLALVKSLNSFGMLQFSSEQKLVPAELVQGLVTSLDDYYKQKAAQENNLKMSFERRLQAGGDQLVALHDDYQELTTTYQAESELKGKLMAAVQHLEKTFVRVTRQKQTLAKFFLSLKDQTNA